MGLASVGVLVTTLAMVGSASQAGAEGLAKRDIKRLPAIGTTKWSPLGVSTKQTTVVVQLSGDPVTVVDANSATPLSKSQRNARKDALRQAQAPVESRIRSLGGKVLATYQQAYNGVKVQIAQNKVDSLRSIPNVIGVHKLQTFKPDNIHGVPLIGAPQVWDGLDGLHGEGVKIAIIDTGIDYTHADFGGPGTAAAYQAALATDTAPADTSLFGPSAPKVKGGIDLVGDDYNANPSASDYQPVPHPDPNPLDCAGHGTHVAGTAAGYGVLSDGTTYHGPYSATTVSGNDWTVGPGVAPEADVYSIRVFGCTGSTDVVVDAIEWAVDHNMDVINMSLGSPWGTADDPSAVAANNAASDGVIVVASAGNETPNPYEEGSPASGSDVISVAAVDPTSTYPGAHAALSTGATSEMIDANGASFADGLTLPVVVLKNPDGSIATGCDRQQYLDTGVSGKIVVTARNTCARVARAVFGQQAGAAAVVMINNASGLPPYEGHIAGNPDDGEAYDVTIPFFGAVQADGPKWLAADGGTVTLTATTLDNPGYLKPASFTSGGPRSGDSWLKPNVAAPGVSIFSAAMGTGNGVTVLSGTSMAAPHTTGMAALVRQAHPRWRSVKYLKAAIENTADPSKVNGYSTRVAGVGLIQAPGATATDVVALGNGGTAALNFGFKELTGTFGQSKVITLHNFSRRSAAFDVAGGAEQGSPHSVHLSRTHLLIPPHGIATVTVTLTVDAATAGDSSAFNDVAGLVTFTPTRGNNGVSLRVPYYLVPQTTSAVTTRLSASRLSHDLTATATVTNRGAGTGNADWYAWGLHDSHDSGLGHYDVTNVGVQSFPSDGFMVFAVTTAKPWSTAADGEWDILLDVNNDGVDDYGVIGVDYGLVALGDATGQVASLVINLHTGSILDAFLAGAPYNSTTLTLPVLIGDLCDTGSPCLSESNPRFTYHAASYSELDSAVYDTVDGTASFNAFTPSISTGMWDTVAPGGSATETVTIDSAEWAQTPALGLMILSTDNRSSRETETIKVHVPLP